MVDIVKGAQEQIDKERRVAVTPHTKAAVIGADVGLGVIKKKTKKGGFLADFEKGLNSFLGRLF